MRGALEQAVRKALAEVKDPRDGAAVELAATLAARIDLLEPAEKLGPALLQCLESLLMTPRARAAISKAVTSDEPKANPLDELRRRREQRPAG